MAIPKVAYQGEPGAYSDMAIKKYFQGQTQGQPRNTFEELFEAVASEKADFGMVPIENSIAGSVRQNYDLLAKYDLTVIGEFYLRICHNLLVYPDPKIKDKKRRLEMIKKVYSHPQALLQCQKFFKDHFWMKAIQAEDTAGSAQDLARKKAKKEAAIASSEAARIYKLEILKQRIETNKKNFTRFVVIGRQPQTTRANKGSIIFSTAHKPGALYKILAPFTKEGINLTKIESRPIIGRPWEYLIYLDFEAKSVKKKWSRMEKHLQKQCSYLKVLGFYRKGKTSAS